MQRSILLVDDEQLLREVLELKLNGIFDVCLHANNGKEALEQLALHPEIDVILSDIKMPVMDGPMFIKEARGNGFNQPILFFTAYASRETIELVRPYGVHGFIDKDKMEDLEDALLSALNRGGDCRGASGLPQKTLGSLVVEHKLPAITSESSGLPSEVFTDKDNFLLILAGAVLVDLQYFERKAR
jgi:CheY-like chemotaxis protein